jgi:hypothetical protein
MGQSQVGSPLVLFYFTSHIMYLATHPRRDMLLGIYFICYDVLISMIDKITRMAHPNPSVSIHPFPPLQRHEKGCSMLK